MLALGDLKNLKEKDIKQHIESSWVADAADLKRFKILIAYESVGDYGCDSSGFYLFKEKATGELYEVHGSHCSCYGFEDQYKPEHLTLEYLKSDKFYMGCGGYDGEADANKDAVKAYIKRMK